MEKKKKGIIAEFKEFISTGNVINMAVGVIIGGAMTAIVNSLVNNILSPIIGLITGGAIDFKDLSIKLTDTVSLGVGNFITAVINFFLTAVVIFLFVKAVNQINSLHLLPAKQEEAPAPTTKICPFCKSEISIDAVRCPTCTSILVDETGAPVEVIRLEDGKEIHAIDNPVLE
ncbi:MAG: large conductance mechanosensitive channel protein MscL [Christensenellaceae bacterium]|jgi:large conductance mechanosensitive channel